MAEVKAVKPGWYNAFRPWTLHGAIVPVLLGGAFAFVEGSDRILPFLAALIGGILLQSAANLLNTYGDYEKGLDTVENHTRSPELVTGTLRSKDVLKAGLACLGITALLGIYMIWECGWGILPFGLAGIAGAGLYTIGLSYKYYGLGQLSVFIMMGLLMPMGTYYLMTDHVSLALFLASLPNAMMITAVLGGNELRDFDSDLEGGIKTFSGRLGYKNAMRLYLFFVTAPFVLVPVLIVFDILPITSLIVFLSLYQWYKTYTNTKTARENKKSGFMLVPLAFKQNWVFGLLLIASYIVWAYIQ